jgi:hypothetical protein
MQKYISMFILCACLLFVACKAKKNPKYNPKKCRTCPTFSYETDMMMYEFQTNSCDEV